jgi:nanoRNase/pAp phosphatase (c-di-AMP/oligoRNAs hydrolase)
MSNVVVNWHGNCYDGFGAMWSAKQAFDTMGDPNLANAEYIPSFYGKDKTDFKDQLVIYVDYCPKRNVIDALSKDNLVLVIDHHATAQENLKGLPEIDTNFQDYYTQFKQGLRGAYAKFDMTKSGAGLAYRYFHDTDRLPNLIKFVEDRDLWKFKYGDNTKAFHAYLLSQPFEYEKWTKVSEAAEDHTGLDAIIKKGNSVLEYCHQLVANIVEPAQVYEVNGVKYALFCTSSHWAEVGEYACEKLDLDYSIALTIDFKQNQTRGSIRPKKGTNCLPLANSLGGGGHAGAAGFQMPLNLSPLDIKERIDLFFKENGK